MAAKDHTCTLRRAEHSSTDSSTFLKIDQWQQEATELPETVSLDAPQEVLGPMLPNAPVLQFLCQGHLGKLPFFSSSHPSSIALHHLMWSLSSNWTFLDFVPELSFLQALLVEAYISVCLVSKGTLPECLLYFGAGP
ncbi:unnamed protein product [Sphagnum jensenii]|uniref:Uncharacterized protein n=1 Tax=Sphagnum jensenii TaxID=128206 RepID=A0ABP1B5U5_9BRYO